MTDNDGTGIFVEDHDLVSAEIDSHQIVFRNNAGGNTVGNVVDVATEE